MSPRLFFGNFSFEHHLAQPGWNPPARLRRLDAELAPIWWAVAEEGDFVWAPEVFPESFWEMPPEWGLPQLCPISDWLHLPTNVEIVPWGWTSELAGEARKRHPEGHRPDVAVVRHVNSRAYRVELERELSPYFTGSQVLTSTEEFATLLKPVSPNAKWVLKANWGMSGREQWRGQGQEISEACANWLRARLARQGVVVWEPWLESLAEVGIQCEIPVAGPVEFMGLTESVVDAFGQFAGCWVQGVPEAAWHGQAIEQALRAAAFVQKAGYFGPLGIDAMLFRNLEGELCLRPLQDLNARWTMGRIALGWRRLLQPAERAFWSHLPNSPPVFLSLTRRLSLAPPFLGSSPLQRRTELLIDAPSFNQ